MSAPVFRKRVQKHGMMLISQVFKPRNKVEPAELHYPSKWKSSLRCSSSSEDSSLNGSVNLESDMKGEPTSDSSKENQSVSTSLKNSAQLLHVPVNEERLDGRSGFASFYRNFKTEKEDKFGLVNSSSKTKTQSFLWLVAPFILVASIVIPPIFLRQLIETVLEDTLVTDFVILFFTEAAFYIGAYLFLYITQKLWAQVQPQKPEWSLAVYVQGYRVSSLICLALSVILPIVSIYLVWPWIGPAAAAALVPYMAGLVVQFWFEESMKESSLWPHIQVIFQVYRLHQLNRGAQLAAGLLFTLKGIESTAETLAINGSLQTLMTVIQLLGIICLWSLGSFLVQTSLFQHQEPEQS
ncbi:hypothetical protein O6H91_04G061900 [Diphasiastrum complanatum]|nr:hypothetical protein O6H91_04G061900 [Diphasiastrum complanatum]